MKTEGALCFQAEAGGTMADKTFEERKKIIYDFINDPRYVPMKQKELAIILQVRRQSHQKELLHGFSIQLPVLPGHPHELHPADDKSQTQEAADGLRCHGRNGRSGAAPFQDYDAEQIQENI